VIQNSVKPPGVLKTLLDVVSHVKTTSSNSQNNCKSIVSDDGLSWFDCVFYLFIYFYINGVHNFVQVK
jgi:hypothetical protein